LKSLKIAEHLVANPVTISSNATIGEATRKIIENKISGIIVVNDQSEVQGMLSELDCLRSLLTEIYNEGETGKAKVSSEMTTPVTSNSPDQDIISVAQNMLDHKQ